jgi:hypothetical protein
MREIDIARSESESFGAIEKEARLRTQEATAPATWDNLPLYDVVGDRSDTFGWDFIFEKYLAW